MKLCNKCPLNPNVNPKLPREKACTHVGNMFPNNKLCRYAQEYINQDFVGRRESLLEYPDKLELVYEENKERWEDGKEGLSPREQQLYAKLDFSRLSSIQHQIIELYFFQGKTIREIANELHCSPNKIHYQIKDLKKKLIQSQ